MQQAIIWSNVDPDLCCFMAWQVHSDAAEFFSWQIMSSMPPVMLVWLKCCKHINHNHTECKYIWEMFVHSMNHCVLPFCCIATHLARITILIVISSWGHVDAMCVAYAQVSALHISLPAPTTPCVTWMCIFAAMLNGVQYAFRSLWLWHPHNGDGIITNVPGMAIWGDGVCGLGLK